jgi:hypothetical protein
MQLSENGNALAWSDRHFQPVDQIVQVFIAVMPGA